MPDKGELSPEYLTFPYVGIEHLERLGLGIEIRCPEDTTRAKRLAGMIHSIHLPYAFSGARYNIAAKDDAFRALSISALKRSIDKAVSLKPEKLVMHFAPKQWKQEIVGEYDRLILGIRELASYAQTSSLPICMENNRTYWDGASTTLPSEAIDRTPFNLYFGSTPEEWNRICKDVDRPNVYLTLDTSHAATSTMVTSDATERQRILDAYLASPDRIRHVHWSDSSFEDNRGRVDMHLPIGDGTLPIAFHQRVKALPATKHLERKMDLKTLHRELAFIRQL